MIYTSNKFGHSVEKRWGHYRKRNCNYHFRVSKLERKIKEFNYKIRSVTPTFFPNVSNKHLVEDVMIDMISMLEDLKNKRAEIIFTTKNL